MSMTVPPSSRKKVVHHLDTPFSAVSWPEISLNDQDTILELLCSLLSPLGQYRKMFVKRSKGKRAARRGPKAGPQDDAASRSPPMPELCAKVDVGFNSITRGLEGPEPLCSLSRQPPDQSYSMVFVARGNQSAAFNCHFPKMIGVASKDSPEADKTRLVGFSKPCSDRLSAALGVPRVSSVGVAPDAPGAGPLWEFVQKVVAPVSIPWLQGTGCGEYREAKIASVETSVGTKKARTT